MIGKILAHCILIIRWISINSTTGDNYYLYNGVSVTLKILFLWSGSLKLLRTCFFSSIKFHTKPLMSSLPKLATNCSIGNIWKYGVQSINQSFILTRYVKELKKSFKMRACKLLHDLKKLFILMFFFFNYFFSSAK